MSRLLVIDDHEPSRAELCDVLDSAGFEVVTAPNAISGIDAATSGEFDLILLELVLCGDSGEHVLHEVRSALPSARIVIVSAVKDAGRVAGALDMGAVDFIAKPFRGVELLARVRARLRADVSTPGSPAWPVTARPAADEPSEGEVAGPRVAMTVVESRPSAINAPAGYARTAIGAASTTLTASEFEIDVYRRALVVRGRLVELSQREFLLMCYLLRRRGQICTRQELLAGVWGITFDAQTNVVDVYIKRLRSKLTIDTIDTVRKVGYRLNAA